SLSVASRAGATEVRCARCPTIAWPRGFWLYPRHFPPAGATTRRGSGRGRIDRPGRLIKPGFRSMTALWFIIACGLLAIGYGVWATASVMSADAGSARMQEIAAAVREGAQAYLKRQYTTIGGVGVVICVIVGWFLGPLVATGFAIGALLSAIT